MPKRRKEIWKLAKEGKHKDRQRGGKPQSANYKEKQKASRKTSDDNDSKQAENKEKTESSESDDPDVNPFTDQIVDPY